MSAKKYALELKIKLKNQSQFKNGRNSIALPVSYIAYWWSIYNTNWMP